MMQPVGDARPSADRFSEDQAHAILRRAVELHEIRGLRWSEHELIQIARELDIEEEFVRAAIADIQQGNTRGATSARLPWTDAALLAGIGAVSFLPTGLLGASPLTSIATVAVMSVLLALKSDAETPYRHYLMRNACLWAGFWAGSLVLSSMTPESVLLAITGLPILGGVCAIALGRAMKRVQPSDEDPKAARRGIVRAVLQRVQKVVSRQSHSAPDDSMVERAAFDLLGGLTAPVRTTRITNG